MLEADAAELQRLEQQSVLQWTESRGRSSRRHVGLMMFDVWQIGR